VLFTIGPRIAEAADIDVGGLVGSGCV